MANKTTVRKERVSRVPKGKPTHPGFKAVAAEIKAKNPDIKNPRAVLASSTRKASAKAKKVNPKLKNVKMPKKSSKK